MSVEQAERLTVREAWEWYIQPAMERAEELKKSMDKENGDTHAPADLTDEEFCKMLEALGVLKPRERSDGNTKPDGHSP